MNEELVNILLRKNVFEGIVAHRDMYTSPIKRNTRLSTKGKKADALKDDETIFMNQLMEAFPDAKWGDLLNDLLEQNIRLPLGSILNKLV